VNRPDDARVELAWLPLGSGGQVVAWNGRLYEALAAAWARRPRRALYHCALLVTSGPGRFVVELAPAADARGGGPGVVGAGPVGLAAAGRLRWLRYEVRCWRDGVLPDLADAVGGLRLLSTDPRVAAALLTAVRQVPLLVWGRRAPGTDEMWNSNSVIAWLLDRSGIDPDGVELPSGGRAPGWSAGVALARRRG
jgi:hypothetical protein